MPNWVTIIEQQCLNAIVKFASNNSLTIVDCMVVASSYDTRDNSLGKQW